MTIIIDGTNGVYGVDGAAATPAFQGNDADTGMWFPAANTVALSTGGSERLRLDSSGNLGLGVTPPTVSQGKLFNLQNVGSGFSSTSNVDLSVTNNAYFNSGWKYGINGKAARYQLSDDVHAWYTAPSGTAGNAISFTQAMTLDASGRLGIGTTSPTVPLEVAQSATTYTAIRLANTTAGNNGGQVTFAGAGNVDMGWIRCIYDGVMTFGTWNSSSVVERARITAGGYFKASNSGSYNSTTNNEHEFRNSTGGAHTMGLYNSSASPFGLLINYTGAAPNASSNYFLLCADTGGNRLFIYSNGNVGNANNSYGSISDLKLKENITDATPKLAALNQLRVVNYNLKGDSLKQIGLIAQEVEQVFPGLVESAPDTVEVTKTRTVEVRAVMDEEGNEITPATTREETYTEREPNGETTKSIKYSVLVPMLLKAVQELTAQNDDLRARVAALEGTQP